MILRAEGSCRRGERESTPGAAIGGPVGRWTRIPGLLALLGATVAIALAPAGALGAPVTIPNDVAPSEQFDVTDPAGVEDELHAHGGGMIEVGEHFYWFGEWRNPNGTVNRIPVYRSTHLKGWEYRGVALAASEVAHLTQPNIERPKVIYNASTDKYVMWMHLETNGNYNRAEAAVAIADDVEGPYEWIDSFRPDVPVAGAQPDTHTAPPHMSRDITAFVDDDGAAYMISAADDNRDLHIYRLDDEYTGFAPSGHYLVWDDQWREAPIMLKRNGVYFLLTSGATGWSPNQQMYATATSMEGPWTQPSPVPFANQSAFETQGAHAIAIQGTEETSYLYLADRWAGSFMPSPSVMLSRYVWLPLEFPTDTTVDMPWADSVTIDTETGEVEGVVDDPPEGLELAIEDIAVGSTSNAPQSDHHPFVHASAHNSAANIVDGRHETAWISANAQPGGSPATSWAQFDLGRVTTVDTVRLMLFRGGVRTHPLEILVGETPGDLTPVWSGQTEMKTGFEDLQFTPTDGRYVRVRVTGEGAGDYSNQNRMAPRNSFGIVEAQLYETGLPSESCPSLRSDDFAGEDIDTGKWDFMHPTTPADDPDAPAITDGRLLLRTLPGEIDNEGPVSFVGQPMPPGDHWSVTAKLTIDQQAGWQHAGLALYGDDENFIRLTFTRSNTTGQRFFELVTVRNGNRQQSPQTNLSTNHTDTVLVRLTRIGDQIVPRFSTGGGVFFTAQGGTWVPQTAAAQSTFHAATDRSIAGLTGPEVRIGPYAGGGTATEPNPVAAFDYVHVGPDLELCDDQPPVSTATLDPPEPPVPGGFWYASPIEVTLSAEDEPGGSGVASTRYRIDDGPLERYTGPFWVTDEGIHQVEYFSIDRAGNVEESQTIGLGIDMTPPETVHHLDPAEPDGENGWYRSPVEVELEALAEPDVSSGSCCTEYRIDGGEWTPYGAPLTLADDGERLLEYRSSDGAGNLEEPNAVTIRLDQTTPTTMVALDPSDPGVGGAYAGPVTLTFIAFDAASGVARTEYRIDEGDWTEYSPLEPPTVSEVSDHEIAFRSTDGAGNVEEAQSVEFTIGDDGAGDAQIRAQGVPSLRTVGPNRRQVQYRFRVRNVGEVPSGPVEMCARAPQRRINVLGAACRTFDNVNPGAMRNRAFKLRIKNPARGKLTRIRFVARGPQFERDQAEVRLRVRR